MRDKINGMSKMMGDMSGMMKQMSERMRMGTKSHSSKSFGLGNVDVFEASE